MPPALPVYYSQSHTAYTPYAAALSDMARLRSCTGALGLAELTAVEFRTNALLCLGEDQFPGQVQDMACVCGRRRDPRPCMRCSVAHGCGSSQHDGGCMAQGFRPSRYLLQPEAAREAAPTATPCRGLTCAPFQTDRLTPPRRRKPRVRPSPPLNSPPALPWPCLQPLMALRLPLPPLPQPPPPPSLCFRPQDLRLRGVPPPLPSCPPQLHPNAYLSVFLHLIRVFYFNVLYTRMILVRQDLTYSAGPRETGSAAHP